MVETLTNGCLWFSYLILTSLSFVFKTLYCWKGDIFPLPKYLDLKWFFILSTHKWVLFFNGQIKSFQVEWFTWRTTKIVQVPDGLKIFQDHSWELCILYKPGPIVLIVFWVEDDTNFEWTYSLFLLLLYIVLSSCGTQGFSKTHSALTPVFDSAGSPVKQRKRGWPDFKGPLVPVFDVREQEKKVSSRLWHYCFIRSFGRVR